MPRMSFFLDLIMFSKRYIYQPLEDKKAIQVYSPSGNTLLKKTFIF